MKKLKEKDGEISLLREEISQIKVNFKREFKEKNDEISRLKEENLILKIENQQLKRTFMQKDSSSNK